MARNIVFCSLLLATAEVIRSLRLTQVIAPTAPQFGDTVTLKCPYELERDSLYSVTWFKDNREFFHYVPKYSPPFKVTQQTGLRVNLTGSDAKQVMIGPLTAESTGVYRCQVSATGPSFASVQREVRLTVAAGDGENSVGQLYGSFWVFAFVALFAFTYQ